MSSKPKPPIKPAAGIRVDVWLWAARAYKTRSLAKAAIDAGRVQINGQAVKASKIVALGDEIDFQREHERFVYQVQGIASQRGSAIVAAALYQETPASIELRTRRRAEMVLDRQRFLPSLHKPSKQDRRAMTALHDRDFQ